MKKILLLAASLYFFLAPLTYHPDTKLVLYYPTLNNGRVWDIYTYLNENANAAPKFHYPPAHFWLLKAELPVVKLIGGNQIVKWLNTGGNIAFRDENIFLNNLAVKTPLLILVLISGWLIFKIAVKNGYNLKFAKAAAIIWLFNPITLYSAVIMGQNDILALLPFLIGLWFYFDHPFWAFTWFGLAGSVKSYPLLWALIAGLIYPKSGWIKKISLAMWPIIIYIATMLPFIKYPYFREDVLYSGLSIRMFDSAINIGLGDKVLLVPMLLVALTLIGIKNNLGRNLKKLTLILMSATMIILGFTHFHPQWFIWIMPFMALQFATEEKQRQWWLILPALLIIILLFEDKFLYWGLISPINQEVINLPLINEWLNLKGIDTSLLNNLAHSILAGFGIYGLFNADKKDDEK